MKFKNFWVKLNKKKNYNSFNKNGYAYFVYQKKNSAQIISKQTYFTNVTQNI